MMIDRRRLKGAIHHPAHGFELTPCAVEVRWDPLTGHATRVLEGSRLMPPTVCSSIFGEVN